MFLLLVPHLEQASKQAIHCEHICMCNVCYVCISNVVPHIENVWQKYDAIEYTTSNEMRKKKTEK